jgi:signal transduction histidine kinase
VSNPADDPAGDGDRPAAGLAPAVGRLATARIVLVYVAVGALWVLLSDTLLEALVPDDVQRANLQTAKGALYVVATAALLYVLIERHRARMAARDRQLRAVLDGIADAVLVADARGDVLQVNAAAAALVGSRPEPGAPLSSMALARAVQPRNPAGQPLAPEETALRRALRGEAVTGLEERLRGADGRELFVSVSAAPLRGRDGRVELAVVVVRDVSDRKRFEEAREEFLATAAHELKTPLAVVKAYAQLMMRRAQGDAPGLVAITRQVDRLNRIIHQLLDVSRLRFGAGGLSRERFDLGQLAEEVAAGMPGAGGRIVVAREPGAAVEADRAWIAQVVANLLENALRFSPGGGRVEASVSRRDAEAVLSVRDHGVGIPPERQARVFERYYRAHSGTAHDYGGLGLGLDVSREIVLRHGGRIWFESEAGRGSTFSFSLPIAGGRPP